MNMHVLLRIVFATRQRMLTAADVSSLFLPVCVFFFVSAAFICEIGSALKISFVKTRRSFG